MLPYLELGPFSKGNFVRVGDDEVDLISLSLVSRALGEGGLDKVSLGGLLDMDTSVTVPRNPE